MSEMLGALMAILISMMAVLPYVAYEHQGMVNQQIAATAGQERMIAEAAQNYIEQNYTAIEAAATATTPAVITVPMLQATNMLPTSITGTNPFGQTWTVQVLQPTTGNLQALVLSSGGQSISQGVAPAIAAQTGQDGGFIPYSGQYGSLASTIAEGAYNGWSVSMTGYTNPGAGHLAALVAFTNGNLQNDYLYRVAVPGHPELNTMETNLNMGTNNANNATSYATTNNGAVLENTGTSSMMETQNSTGSYYAYTEGTPTAAAHVASGPDGYAYSLDDAGTMFSGMTDADGSAGSFFDSGGQANELINSPNDKEWILATANNSAAQFNITANSGTGFGFWAASTGESGTSKQFDLPTNASIGSGCSPNGAIAASSTGVTLSCVSGAWTANSGFTQSYQIGVSNGERWYNTGSTPMFVSTYCNPTPNSSGYVENITLDVLTPFGVQYAASQGQVAEGGSDANFAAAPSASVMVPAGWSFITSGTNESCTLLVSQ